MTDRQALLDRIRDLESAVFSLKTKLAVRGYERQIDDLQASAIDLAYRIKMYETALEEIAWSNNSTWQQDRAKHVLAKMRGAEL